VAQTLVSAAPRLVSARLAAAHLYPPGRWLFFTGHLHGAFLSVCRNGESYARPAASQDQSEPVCCNPGKLTALQANLILNRTGETFWQAESYTLGFVMSPSISVLRHLENNRKQLRNFRGRVRMPTRGGHGKKRLDTSVEAADTSVCATNLIPKLLKLVTLSASGPLHEKMQKTPAAGFSPPLDFLHFLTHKNGGQI